MPQRQAGFIIDDEGMALVELVARPSSTQPGRVKMAFVLQLDRPIKLIDPAGHEHALPEGEPGQKMLCGSEFRFECN